MSDARIIRPQPGPQEQFLTTPADIAIFGGAAGCGKSFVLLMEPLRHIDNRQFGAVIFRREMPQITTEGGLWDTATELYDPLGAEFIQSPYRARFPSGAKVEFHHLQLERTVKKWDGSQIPLIGFDELQHFTATQFFYMLSRNRSLCGVRPYVRATCNPDPDSFMLRFLEWWIDQETGYPIYERSGALRWMVRINDVIHWSDRPEELVAQFGKEAFPKSVTFIPARLSDNKILEQADPGYRANLNAMMSYERERLLGGNWFARPRAGDLFKASDFEIVEKAPPMRSTARYWDRAATAPSPANPDPDWTAGAHGGYGYDGYFYVTDVDRFRDGPYEVKSRIGRIASQDTRQCEVVLEHDPGQAGKAEIADYVRYLAGFAVQSYAVSAAKFVRWKPFASHVRSHNVRLVRGAWNKPFIDELESLTDNPKDYGHDDQGDAVAGLFNHLSGAMSGGAAETVNVY